ncbi:MAG: thiamine/thiamine pyrophosphate ABC transporter permease ThiP [Pseudomonadota bacterium]
MARWPRPVTLLSVGAATLVVALTVGAVIPLMLSAEGAGRLVAADWAILRFTLFQAALSAALCTLAAIPLARALARRDFPGRSLVLTLLGAPFLVPVIVAVLGLLSVWGRAGWVSEITGATLDIYGLTGILMAHVFFNLPLVTRMLLTGWAGVPPEHLRLATQLGFTPRDIYTHIERPILREVLPGAALLVFLICLTSFSVALTLGGGPRATTIELAIYQALRFEFDLSRAALLSLMQLGLALTVALILLASGQRGAGGFGLSLRPQSIPKPRNPWIDRAAITAALAFLGLPMLGLISLGIPGMPDLPDATLNAALRSIGVSIAATLISCSLALAIAGGVATHRGRAALLGEGLVLIGLTASPLVIGTALFIAIRDFIDPFAFALPLTALVNATLGVPFALRILLPEVDRVIRTRGPLAQSLGLSRRLWLRRVLLPGIRRGLGLALGLVAAFAMGDLGIIALFGSTETETLPLLMFGLMGSFRTDAAQATGLILVLLTLTIFAIFDTWGRRAQH